jgi:hypothetical protein
MGNIKLNKGARDDLLKILENSKEIYRELLDRVIDHEDERDSDFQKAIVCYLAHKADQGEEPMISFPKAAYNDKILSATLIIEEDTVKKSINLRLYDYEVVEPEEKLSESGAKVLELKRTKTLN